MARNVPDPGTDQYTCCICFIEYVIRNNPRARPSHSAHLSITGQLKWSWGLPLFEIKALLGFRSAGGIPTLVAFSSLIWTLRITGVSVITICGVASIIWSLSWTATGPRCTWAGGLSRIHVTCNIDLQRNIIRYPTLTSSYLFISWNYSSAKDTFSILFVNICGQIRFFFLDAAQTNAQVHDSRSKYLKYISDSLHMFTNTLRITIHMYMKILS